MNIAISIENEIIREGIIKIISDGLFVSNVYSIDKTQLEQSANIQNFHLVILDDKQIVRYSKKIIELNKEKLKIKFFFLSDKKLSQGRLKMFEDNSILLIKNNSSSKEVLSIIEGSFFLKKRHVYQVDFEEKQLESDPVKLLSKREMQIALLLVKGFSTKQISVKSKISMSTVSTYKSRIFHKTRTSNIVQIINLFGY